MAQPPIVRQASQPAPSHPSKRFVPPQQSLQRQPSQRPDNERGRTPLVGQETLTADDVALLERKKPKTRVGIAMQDTSDEMMYWYRKYRKYICWTLYILFHLLVIAHFVWATWYYIDSGRPQLFFCDDYGFLILLFITFYIVIFYYYIYVPFLKEKVDKAMEPFWNKVSETINKPCVRWVLCGLIIAAMLIFILIDCAIDNDWERLIPLAGVFVILFLFVAFSKYPGYIEIKPIISGFAIMFIFGLITIRWKVGRDIFQCAGDKVADFIHFGIIGSQFVYAELAAFAFTALSTTYFVVAVVQILYYYGCVQKFVVGFGGFLQVITGTTVVESVNAAANIFLSMVEAPIMLAPYLQLLTPSELHTIITSGFATVAGLVLAAYISFGASPATLITASVMAAPASLVLSKIFYPETEYSLTTRRNIVMVKSAAENCVDAACQGAHIAIDIVLGIIANTIAFVSIVAFLDGILTWLGILVGQEDWTIVEISSFLFMPLVFLMGIPWKETPIVARVIATKVIINEFVAFKVLGGYKKDQNLSPRSIMVATYAICGFANPASVGVIISSMIVLVPQKKPILAHIVMRAFIAGTASNFMAACICAMLTPKAFLKTQ